MRTQGAHHCPQSVDKSRQPCPTPHKNPGLTVLGLGTHRTVESHAPDRRPPGIACLGWSGSGNCAVPYPVPPVQHGSPSSGFHFEGSAARARNSTLRSFLEGSCCAVPELLPEQVAERSTPGPPRNRLRVP